MAEQHREMVATAAAFKEVTMTPKTTVNIDGIDWHLYSIEYQDNEGRKYSFDIYAISREHAACILDDIKNSATIGDRVVEFVK